LKAEAKRLRRLGATVQEVLLHGKWAETAVVQYLEQHPSELVVLSSVSKTTFDRWTIGSVSERISQRSPVPTLVVRAPEALLEWIRGGRKLQLVVAVDFSVNSDAALTWAATLAKFGSCAITVAHINWPPDEEREALMRSRAAVQARAATGTTGRNRSRVRRQLALDLQRKVDEILEGSAEVVVKSNWGRPDAAVVHLANQARADLIVIGAQQRQGLRRLAHTSISRGVLRHAPMSVVCVPVSVAIDERGRRTQVRRVLVATDFSANGDQAIPWAYAVTRPGGVVKLVHVITSKKTPTRRLIVEAQNKLKALIPVNAFAEGIESETEVLMASDPAKAIGIAARSFGPDILCLGARGHGLIVNPLAGSVARAVMEQNRQPVLLVPATPP
jgi:nucleotide-binding universal stress UspA family protein